ncbi:thioredoxin-like [Carcharodon carcharias]|uniref:thioredoxin-like n=1 Tax=Carcharodon carcharias TaxID=13397 RepID=UPI001B7ED8CB|nr:thioredoxin-like [Carcharodon carcharias]
MGVVGTIKCLVEYEAALRVSEQQLVILLFSANWCEFCQMIQLYFDQFAECYPNVVFYEVDINVAKDVVHRCHIEWFPTFQFYRAGAKVFQFKGPNRCLLERMIQKLQGDGSRCTPRLNPTDT